jgi:hypothetical protein
MEIKTKFNLKDKVYPIRMGGYYEFIKCQTCEGEGCVTINNTGKTIKCPDCWGTKGQSEWKQDKWYICEESYGQIGKIDIEIYDKDYYKNDCKYGYMIDTTGVGSGTVYAEDNLFKSKKTAQKECDRRNAKNITKDGRPKYIRQGSKTIK